MKTGRAAVYEKPREPLAFRDYPIPRPGPGEILTRVLRTNLCGSDLHKWRGDWNAAHPIILGHELVAEVVEAAPGRPFAKGDRIVFTLLIPCGTCPACADGDTHVCATATVASMRPCDRPPHFTGGLAEYYLVDAKQAAFRVPDALPTEIAAAANCAVAQILHTFDRAAFRSGESIVIQGAGGLGLYATCLARELGASKIVVVDAIPARLELARAFGAHETLDAGQVTDARERTRTVLHWTGGRGADVVLEVAGIPDLIPEGIRMLDRRGRYMEVGSITPRKTCVLDPSILVGGNKSILGVGGYPTATLPKALEFLTRVHQKYPLARMTRSFTFEQVNEALVAADALGREKTEVVRASICFG